MMKKTGIVLVCLMMLLVLPLRVSADVIFVPDDPFYEEHFDACSYLNRGYTANGPEGDVTMYESPESQRVIQVLEQGEAVWISYTYTDPQGNQWGYWEDFRQDIRGWMPMEYLRLVYDHISFAEDYADQIVSQEGALDEAYVDQKVWFWEYPGSEAGYEVTILEYTPDYSSLFVDEEGRRWGCVGYYMGFRNVWLCLDDPTADADALYPQGSPQRDTRQEEAPDSTDPIVPTESTERKQMKLWLIIGVIGVMAVTGVILLKMKRK